MKSSLMEASVKSSSSEPKTASNASSASSVSSASALKPVFAEPTLMVSVSAAVKREAQRSGRTLAGAWGDSCQSSALERLSSDCMVLR